MGSLWSVSPPPQGAINKFEALEDATCRVTTGKPEALLKAI
jgi:hypothetical protein